MHRHQGPKNSLNDLDYKKWLQFQKSFERCEFRGDNLPACFDELAKSFVLFFTKATTETHQSRVLTNVFGLTDISSRTIVMAKGDPLSANWLQEATPSVCQRIDYALLLIDSLETAKDKEADLLCSFLARTLNEGSYSTLFCSEQQSTYPLIWAFANAGRKSLQLCDEKIYLDEKNVAPPLYALQFRNAKDKLAPKPLDHHIVSTDSQIPKYIIPRPAPRKKDEFTHPAKFPEDLVKVFIGAFTEENDWVLDIMAGTGSALIAAYEMGRNSVGVELDSDFVKIAKKRIMRINPPTRLPGFFPTHTTDLIQGDARNLISLISKYKGKINYCITSPPYWNMLHNPGSEGQRSRRQKNLRLVYSKSDLDLGNINDYRLFIATLRDIYEKVGSILEQNGRLTIIAKNVKKEGCLYTFPWDLVDELSGDSGKFNFAGYSLWCQDDVALKPFAIGHHWVSNILHHYCLHFTRRT